MPHQRTMAALSEASHMMMMTMMRSLTRDMSNCACIGALLMRGDQKRKGISEISSERIFLL